MITRIEVNGFKSLEAFELNFEPGLNILVGPNGSGKTNIVSFFEFLAYLMNSDASEATSFVGGAGAVFRRLGSNYERRIQSRIFGCIEVRSEKPKSSERSDKSSIFYAYLYEFTLIFPEAGDSVLFEKQRFRVRRTKEFSISSETNVKWALDVEMSYQGSAGSKVTFNSNYDEILDVTFFPIRKKKNKDPKTQIEELLGEMLKGGNVSLVPTLCRYALDSWQIIGDLTGGQIYNVVPSKLKLPEDSAKPPCIARDGSGLAATLYALQRSKEPSQFGDWSYYYRASKSQYNPASLDRLKGYLSLVNSSVQDIDVFNDPFDNQLRVRFTIQSGSYKATLPMSLMSDGTLKWLAVVTAAVTATSVFCIEEPENYLHPEMQGQVVNILREILFGDEEKRFTLMTTHSETLLNHCRPEELIIVCMQEGRTEAKRCSNALEVSDEISRTGFGLGYYFVSNILQND